MTRQGKVTHKTQYTTGVGKPKWQTRRLLLLFPRITDKQTRRCRQACVTIRYCVHVNLHTKLMSPNLLAYDVINSLVSQRRDINYVRNKWYKHLYSILPLFRRIFSQNYFYIDSVFSAPLTLSHTRARELTYEHKYI